MRDDSDPIEQMIEYVRKIRENEVSTSKDRPFGVTETTPFYCYAICDLKQTLVRKFLYTHKMTMTPDQLGYFSYHQHINAYIEVVSYDKLLDDAKLRNRILFDKLNIHA